MRKAANIQEVNGQFRARVQVHGRRISGRLRATKRQAEADVAAIRAQHSGTVTVSDVTLSEALDLEIADSVTRGVSEIAMTVPRWVKSRTLKLFEPDVPLVRIGKAELERFARMLLDGAAGERPIAANSVANKVFPGLKRAWLLAGVPWPDPRPPKRTEPEMPYFELPEIPALLDRIAQSRGGNKWEEQACVVVLATTGMRAYELARMTAKDVDFARGEVRIVNAKRRGFVHRRPITELARPYFEFLVRNALPDGRLFNRLHRPTELLAHAKARLKEPRLHCRALRHTYGTALHMGGAPLRTAMSAMGHTTTGSHLRYLHATDQGVRDAIHSVSAAIPELPAGIPTDPSKVGRTSGRRPRRS